MCTLQFSPLVTHVEQGPRHWKLLVFTRREGIYWTTEDEDRAIKEREAELWDLELAAYKGDIEGLLDSQILGVPLEKIQKTKAGAGTNWMRVVGH